MTTEQSDEAGESGVAAWEALLRAHAAVVPVVAAEVEAQTGIPLSWYDVVLELNRAPERRLRMQELGERVVLSRSRVSRIVDELSEHGLVTKTPDPHDGRATLATLTAPGRQMLRRVAPVYLNSIDRHFTSRLRSKDILAIGIGLGQLVATQDELQNADSDA